MLGAMSKTERVRAALNGQPVDRVPVSAWWHDYKREWTAADLAAMTLEAYRKYDWDYIKVNPRFTYFTEGWGAEWRRYDDRLPQLTRKPVESPEDLARIDAQGGTDGAWGEQLEALKLIADGLGGEAPFMQTVFTPLSVLPFLTGSPRYAQRLIAERPEEVQAVLENITQTMIPYVRAVLDAGASGIFFATVDFGTADNLSWEDYQRFGRPYDMRVLEAVQGAPLNMLHVCRGNNHLPNMLDYPVAAFHWDVGAPGNPTLENVLSRTDKAVAGGVQTRMMQFGHDDDVELDAGRALAATNRQRHLLAPACSIDPASPEANLRALVGAARG